MKPTALGTISCFLSLALFGCLEPKPTTPSGTVSETTDARPSARPPASLPPTAQSPETTETSTPASAPARAAQSWAQQLCGAGPLPAPLEGVVKATPLPQSEPTALDPKDTGFHLYEGAVWFDGALHFSDFKTSEGFPSRILKYEGGALSVVVPDSGSNGLTLDPSGTKLALARHATKSVSVREPGGEYRVVAGEHADKPFNSPNDLVFRSDGNLYFTDPAFQAGPNPTQPSTNVYRVAPDGAVSVVDATIRNPNGIALSPDEQTLYVAGNMEQGRLVRYPVASDGSIGPGEILLDGITVPDGLAVDCAGNLYVTEHTQKRIRVISSSGQELGRITGLEKNVTNVAFGGPRQQTLFITTTGKLYSLELPLPGSPY